MDRQTDGIVVASTALAMRALRRAVKNTETIPKRFGIVLELFLSSFRLINIIIHMLKNMQISKQFHRSQTITNDHTRITLY